MITLTEDPPLGTASTLLWPALQGRFHFHSNGGGKARPLWVALFPAWDLGLCRWRYGVEQQHEFVIVCFVIVEVI